MLFRVIIPRTYPRKGSSAIAIKFTTKLMSSNQKNFDNALLVNVYTNAGLGVLFLLCFELIRKRLPRIYEPRVSEGYV
jgi:hypothetical protein